MSRIYRAVGLVGLLAALGSCHTELEVPPSEFSCTDDTDCGEGLICQARGEQGGRSCMLLDDAYEVCGNGEDDDRDGAPDCDDSDCAEYEDCQTHVPEDCAQPGDEDGDGDENCDDSDCSDFQACVVTDSEVCDQPGDEDGDGDENCDDSDCAELPICQTDADGDGVDDNEDNCPEVANPDQADANSDGVGDACDGIIPLGDAGAKITGENVNEGAGVTVSGAGDVNGDNLQDILISSQERVCLAYGHTIASGFIENVCDVTFNRGSQAASAGDVNNDGYDDVLIGEPGSAGGGIVHLVLGASDLDGYVDLGENGVRYYTADSVQTLLGASVAGVGNFNGDPYDDFVIGTRGGNAYLVLGSEIPSGGYVDTVAITIRPPTASDGPTMVSAAGDVDGDSLDDILIGKSRWSTSSVSGSAYVIRGRVSPPPSGWDLPTDADARINGQGGQETGRFVGPAGDVNGDGKDDFLVYGDGGQDGSELHLFMGESSLPISYDFSDAAVHFYNTASTAVPLDADGDDSVDLLFGSPSDSAQEPKAAYLVLDAGALSGGFNLDDADIVFRSRGRGEMAGASVASGGDIDEDGRDEILIGAPREDVGGASNAGAAYLFFSSDPKLEY